MNSFVMIERKLVTDNKINGNEFRVHSFLLMMYNENKGYAFPSIEFISKEVNMSESTVKRCINKLQELGYVEISKRKGLAGNFNIYSKLKHLITRKNKNVNTPAEAKIEATIINDENMDKFDEVEDSRTESERELDNNINVRLARSVTNIDKSNFAKIILSMADERLTREAIRNFKAKKGKSATFLISILVDEYFKASTKFPIKMLNLLRKGLNNPFLEQPLNNIPSACLTDIYI